MEEIRIDNLGLVAIQTNRWNRMLHLSKDGITPICNAADSRIVEGKSPKPAGHATCMRCLKSNTLKVLRGEAQRESIESGKLYVVHPFRQQTRYHFARIIEVDSGDTFGTKESLLRTMCGLHVHIESTVSEVESTELRATCMYCLGSPQTPQKFRDRIAAENIREFRSRGGGDHGIGATDGPIWEPQP